ncbi:MAG: L-threonylcarbamoyladenylate synthase [Crocinitomicaceae bacterium]|nr:L-threonylcarbamoyladenylate synthase [Crocinitomicaceae bacterium]
MKNEFAYIVEKLKNGATMLYPTDTIWGLGCDATNEEACQKILAIKNRPTAKSFIVLVDGFPMLERYVPDFHPICYDLADLAIRPLTIIYPNAKGFAPSVVAEDGSVGIRITKDPICLQLIRGLRKPIVSTSANLSGEKSPISFDTISPEIKSEVDVTITQRMNERMEKASQIIKVGLGGQVQIIRK